MSRISTVGGRMPATSRPGETASHRLSSTGTGSGAQASTRDGRVIKVKPSLAVQAVFHALLTLVAAAAESQDARRMCAHWQRWHGRRNQRCRSGAAPGLSPSAIWFWLGANRRPPEHSHPDTNFQHDQAPRPAAPSWQPVGRRREAMTADSRSRPPRPAASARPGLGCGDVGASRAAGGRRRSFVGLFRPAGKQPVETFAHFRAPGRGIRPGVYVRRSSRSRAGSVLQVARRPRSRGRTSRRR